MKKRLLVPVLLCLLGSSARAATVDFVNDAGIRVRIAYFRGESSDSARIEEGHPVYLEAGESHAIRDLPRDLCHYMVCGGGWCSYTTMAVHEAGTDYVARVYLDDGLISTEMIPEHWDEYFGRTPRKRALSIRPDRWVRHLPPAKRMRLIKSVLSSLAAFAAL